MWKRDFVVKLKLHPFKPKQWMLIIWECFRIIITTTTQPPNNVLQNALNGRVVEKTSYTTQNFCINYIRLHYSYGNIGRRLLKVLDSLNFATNCHLDLLWVTQFCVCFNRVIPETILQFTSHTHTRSRCLCIGSLGAFSLSFTNTHITHLALRQHRRVANTTP